MLNTLNKLFLLVCIAVLCLAQINPETHIKTIQIGSMGQSDEAERFRLLLDSELGKVGFATTDDPAHANAILTGALSVRVYADTSRARVTLVLKTPDGKQIWGKDFQPHVSFKGSRDTVKLRAQDAARTLKKDLQP